MSQLETRSQAIIVGDSIKIEQGLDHIFLLIDRSGSMFHIWESTVRSIKEFLHEQEALAGRRISLDICTFNEKKSYDYLGIRPTRDAIDAITLPLPDGGTALLDSMGSSINELMSRLRNQEKRPERVYFVTATDGAENCSVEWTRMLVRARVEAAISQGWEFIYLGANQDAFSVAEKIGIPAASTSNYSTGNTSGAYKGVSANVLRSRTTGALAAFSEDDRKIIGALGSGN